ERGPARSGERPCLAAPGCFSEVPRAAPDLQYAVRPRLDPAVRQAVEQRLAVAAAAERRMGKAQQVRDGTLHLVEASPRRQPIGPVVGAGRVLGRSGSRQLFCFPAGGWPSHGTSNRRAVSASIIREMSRIASVSPRRPASPPPRLV